MDISTSEDAARLLLLRRAARERLADYMAYIEVPGRPTGDGEIFEQVETSMGG